MKREGEGEEERREGVKRGGGRGREKGRGEERGGGRGRKDRIQKEEMMEKEW